jgi:hypothetical protein
MQMTRKQLAEQWAEHRRQRDEEERQSRVMVITEFDAGDSRSDPARALADEILTYRRAVRLLAKAIGWADARAPFALIAPGPLTGSGARSWSSKLHARVESKSSAGEARHKP